MNILIDFSTANQDEYLFQYSIYNCLIKPMVEENDISFFVIVSKELAHTLNLGNYKKCKFIGLDFDLYNSLGFTREEVFYFLYNQNNKERYFEKIKSIYKYLTKNVTPDIIITFEFGNCVLKDLFPNVLNLTWLGGLWKSLPPDFSIVMDPINSCCYSSLIKFKEEIDNFHITKEQEEEICKLKNIFKQKIIKTNIAKEKLLKYKKEFKHLILLPLQLQSYIFEDDCDFKSQHEYLEYVLDRVPKDIGVVVTGHYVNIQEIKSLLKENNNKYSNLIIIDEVFNYAQASLFVLPYVDAMINVCSSLVLKALLCGVPIISLGKKYNLWCQDTNTLDNIEAFLNSKHKSKNNILYWYLTRYDIPVKILTSKGFLYNYLKNKMTNGSNITFDYFNENVSIKSLIKYYSSVKYNKKLSKSILKKSLLRIFSINITRVKLVIYILGIKITANRK